MMRRSMLLNDNRPRTPRSLSLFATPTSRVSPKKVCPAATSHTRSMIVSGPAALSNKSAAPIRLASKITSSEAKAVRNSTRQCGCCSTITLPSSRPDLPPRRMSRTATSIGCVFNRSRASSYDDTEPTTSRYSLPARTAERASRTIGWSSQTKTLMG